MYLLRVRFVYSGNEYRHAVSTNMPLAGPLCCSSLASSLFASVKIFLYEKRCERQRASSCDRMLAPPRTAAALPMVHHLLTVVVARVF